MSCNRQQFPAAICGFIERVTGETVSQTDWHALVELARERGYDTGRARVDMHSLPSALTALGKRENRADLANSAIASAGFTEVGDGYSIDAVNGKFPAYTKNMAAVTRMLTTDGVAASLADARGEKCDSPAQAPEGHRDPGGSGSLSNANSIPTDGLDGDTGRELSANAITHLGSGKLPDGWSFKWDEEDYLATVTTPSGSYLNYILARGTLQVWWVESKSKGEGTALISDAVKRTGASVIAWGETTESGLALAKSWHINNPDGPSGVCADDYGEDISVLKYVPLPFDEDD